jgi:hypothetical protein
MSGMTLGVGRRGHVNAAFCGYVVVNSFWELYHLFMLGDDTGVKRLVDQREYDFTLGCFIKKLG